MAETREDTRLLSLSTHLYRGLLQLYPPGFRQQFGGPMLQLFGDCCRRALQSGSRAGFLALWTRTMLDVLLTAFDEHIHALKITAQGDIMTKDKWIRLGAWAFPTGGLAITLGLLASGRPEYNPFSYYSQWYDRYANLAATPLVSLGLLLLSAGLIALLVAYYTPAGSLGRLILGLGAICGVISAAGAIGVGINDSSPWWAAFTLGMSLQFLCLGLFGIICLSRRLLPGGNGLPLLAGIWLPLLMLLSIVGLPNYSGSAAEMPGLLFTIAWLLSLAGLLGLGLRLAAASSGKPSAQTV